MLLKMRKREHIERAVLTPISKNGNFKWCVYTLVTFKSSLQYPNLKVK